MLYRWKCYLNDGLILVIIIHHGRLDFPKQGESATAVIEAGGTQTETCQENTVCNLVSKVTIYTSFFSSTLPMSEVF